MKNRKLTIFYKIHNKLCPPYLFNCLPPMTSDVNNHNLRNNQNCVLPRCRLSAMILISILKVYFLGTMTIVMTSTQKYLKKFELL